MALFSTENVFVQNDGLNLGVKFEFFTTNKWVTGRDYVRIIHDFLCG